LETVLAPIWENGLKKEGWQVHIEVRSCSRRVADCSLVLMVESSFPRDSLLLLEGTWQAGEELLETTKAGRKVLVTGRKGLLCAHGAMAGHRFWKKCWQGPSRTRRILL
jgi:hypothetical protein